MNRRAVIKRKRKCSPRFAANQSRPRYRLVDLLPKEGEVLPVLEGGDRLVPVGREIL